MKKLIIHTCKDCKMSQQIQCISTCTQLPKYFEYNPDRDTRITARWTRLDNKDRLTMYHDRSDVCVFTWDNGD